ncbi:hypothetical protein BDV93DRAFT_565607 [Ceratobasidium sp. AG-I]|nr:hypothetical protein BDV93DRAFT_565607 [Ceratobasidium sp. AG-I]
MAPVQSKPVAEASSSRRGPKTRAPPKSPEPTPRKRGGRQPGALNFGNDELDTLIDLVRIYNPLGTEAWQALCMRHNEVHERANRNWKGLKKKWEDLSNERPPTGTAKSNAYHELALEVKAELELKNATDTLNDKRGGKAIITDADLVSGDEEAKEDEEDEAPEEDEEEVKNEAVGWADEETWEIEQDADADADALDVAEDTDDDNMAPQVLPARPKPLAPPFRTPTRASGSKSNPKSTDGKLPFQSIPKGATPVKSTTSKPAVKASATPVPNATAGKVTSATKATAKPRGSTASKGKSKVIELSPSPPPIDVDAYVEPKKRAHPDSKDDGRIVRKKPTYETKPTTSTPARGRQQAMESTADKLLEAVKPEVAEEAAATKQIHMMNNMITQNHLREIAQLKNDQELLRRELNGERDKVYQEREKVQAEREKRYTLELQLSQMQSMVSVARAYGPEILSGGSIGLGPTLGQYSAPAPPRHPAYTHQGAFAPQGSFMPGYQQNQPALDPGLAPPQMNVPFAPAASNLSAGGSSIPSGPSFQPHMHPFAQPEPGQAVASSSSGPVDTELTAPNEFAPPGATAASAGDSEAH